MKPVYWQTNTWPLCVTDHQCSPSGHTRRLSYSSKEEFLHSWLASCDHTVNISWWMSWLPVDKALYPDPVLQCNHSILIMYMTHDQRPMAPLQWHVTKCSLLYKAAEIFVCLSACLSVPPPFFRHDRRTATKFGTHVRVDTGPILS